MSDVLGVYIKVDSYSHRFPSVSLCLHRVLIIHVFSCAKQLDKSFIVHLSVCAFLHPSVPLSLRPSVCTYICLQCINKNCEKQVEFNQIQEKFERKRRRRRRRNKRRRRGRRRRRRRSRIRRRRRRKFFETRKVLIQIWENGSMQSSSLS